MPTCPMESPHRLVVDVIPTMSPFQNNQFPFNALKLARLPYARRHGLYNSNLFSNSVCIFQDVGRQVF